MIMGLIVVALAFVQPAFAQEKDAAYFCVEETIAGLKFNEATEMWDPKTVRPEHKFVIRMKFVRTYNSLQMSDYDITMTEAGTDDAASCTNRYHIGAPVQVADEEFGCRTKFFDFIVNIKTMRFLRIYSEGYVGGKDIGADAPSISGGKCTKVDN